MKRYRNPRLTNSFYYAIFREGWMRNFEVLLLSKDRILRWGATALERSADYATLEEYAGVAHLEVDEEGNGYVVDDRELTEDELVHAAEDAINEFSSDRVQFFPENDAKAFLEAVREIKDPDLLEEALELVENA